jgi:hypothetical protein
MPPKRATTKSKPVKTPRLSKTAAKKLDLYAKHTNEYVAGKLPALVRVGPAKYLSISGRSAPNADEFHRAIGALYNVAFTIKMARKLAGFDYTVTKLEALWWLDGAPVEPTPTTVWNWQLLLRVPPFISSRELYDTIDSLIAKGKSEEVRRVTLVDIDEGPCVQILHTGPYTEERESIAKMRAFAERAGRTFSGKHHEIYLSDPRRVKPEKLKTILRQPVA